MMNSAKIVHVFEFILGDLMSGLRKAKISRFDRTSMDFWDLAAAEASLDLIMEKLNDDIDKENDPSSSSLLVKSSQLLGNCTKSKQNSYGIYLPDS
ncbi:unnamed protein product [Hymenolepis diminuta]|uniref:DUF3475 domain-containing protein n=1 Tax=Hymenolepis diminuta TaxID=6216 RepID=A0A0R3SG88_HYMDI|nr:unnamed protein product [Hymenolepis diminuta]